jgi:hypothetical protein
LPTARPGRVAAIAGTCALALGLPLGLPSPSAAQETTLAVTVYNQNFGLVKDVRDLKLDRGIQEIRIDDVAASIDPTSVHFKPLDHPGSVAVLEQNYQYDLAGADRLMNRYLNREVVAVMNDATVQEGTLLSFDSGSLVLQNEDGVSILSRGEVRDISLGDLPGGLVVKPTLVWTLSSDRAGTESAEVSYLTDNLNWHAEYVAVVDENDTEIDLSGWVSVDNQSGATYEHARLKLVAGDVHRVQDRLQAMTMIRDEMGAAAPSAKQFASREFFEYHIYTLERPATLADRETKQLSLFPTATTPVEKVLTYDPLRRGEDILVELEFVNGEENGLGMPLPAGKMRVFKADADGALEFVGEDRIDHTPRDEELRVYLGNAFDVKGERKRTNYRTLSERSHEETFEVELRNHKREAVEVVVVEHFRSDWRILQESHSHEKIDSHTVEYTLAVPADETVTLTYTVRTSW